MHFLRYLFFSSFSCFEKENFLGLEIVEISAERQLCSAACSAMYSAVALGSSDLSSRALTFDIKMLNNDSLYPDSGPEFQGP